MSLKDIGKQRFIRWAEEATGWFWGDIQAFVLYAMAIAIVLGVVLTTSGCRSSVHANVCLDTDCNDTEYAVRPGGQKTVKEEIPDQAHPEGDARNDKKIPEVKKK